MSHHYSDAEAALEAETLALFARLGWDTLDCTHETYGKHGTLGRDNQGEVVLRPRLEAALRRLNPDAPEDAIDGTVEELTRDRSAMSFAEANRQVYRLLKDGVKVAVRGDDDEESLVTLRVIAWDDPAENDFFLASQFWVTGEMYTRRADLVGFVNGLPLVFGELKAHHRRLEEAYRKNLRDYKASVPQLFWYNAFIIFSNGSQSRVGSLTADWGHFGEWKRVADEREQGVISLETIIRATCTPACLLDVAENFVLFKEARGGLIKIVAKNHQYLGVNRAVEAVQHISENGGRLGVFWHTQGSGKSLSMAFFAQKVLRKLPGNWTFVVVTDRDDLDTQIYKEFARAGVVTEPENRVHAGSAAHLESLLREDHRYVFTLIQKFRTAKGGTYPLLSDRSDVIVMTDEAHRSQYDIFAANMRTGLPHAAFIGFTGTPLIRGEEERTREVFGDYVSIYNFKQSVDDGATVPLYYENRIPELQLTNADLNPAMEQLLEAAEVGEAEEAQVQREFVRQYQLITREDRLEKIAEDIVAHFLGRGYQGKAMVVSIDRVTAVRMYDKVQTYWRRALADLEERLQSAQGDEREALARQIERMRETEMAVVVSQSQNEVEDFKKRGLEIAPHRRRMVTENLDEKFKNPADPLRIVFVCAMWMTGFDVESCSTIYLDKPMRNHTLMQTIARANRVFGEKVNGLIVDYIGVFRDLQKALAIYGSTPAAAAEPGELPVNDVAALVEQLRAVMSQAVAFCADQGVDLAQLDAAQGFERIGAMDQAVENLLVNDETKARFLAAVRDVDRLFHAILPHPAANEFVRPRSLLLTLSEKMRSLAEEVDISGVMESVEELLDESVAAERPNPYVINAPAPGSSDHLVDLSRLDFDALRAQFDSGRKRTAAERLRGALNSKLQQMIRLNRTRMNYRDAFQRLIDDYNVGATTVDDFFTELVAFARQLDEEEKRGVAKQLSEEELALFDILTKPDPMLTPDEERQVNTVAHELLQTLKTSKLVLDWRKRQQARAAVRQAIENALDQGLPDAYDQTLYQDKCDRVYQHVYDSYYGEGRSVYVRAS